MHVCVRMYVVDLILYVWIYKFVLLSMFVSLCMCLFSLLPLLAHQIFGGILRCYAIVFAFFVAIAETEWQWVFKFWKVLENSYLVSSKSSYVVLFCENYQNVLMSMRKRKEKLCLPVSKNHLYLLGQRMMRNHMKIKIQPCNKNYRYLEAYT